MAIYNSGNMTPEELKMLDGVIEEEKIEGQSVKLRT